jgi:hypothetical protein
VSEGGQGEREGEEHSSSTPQDQHSIGSTKSCMRERERERQTKRDRDSTNVLLADSVITS